MTKKQTTLTDAVDGLKEEAETETGTVVIDQRTDNEMTPYDDTADLEQYEDDDESRGIPTLMVVQKSHDDYLDHLGSLYSPELDMPFETMRASILVKFQSRVMFPDKYKKDNDPLCRSNDGVKPAGDIVDSDGNAIDPYGDACGWDPATLKKGVDSKHFCAYADWDGDTPPACKEVQNLVLLDMDLDMPFKINFSSTSLKPLKDFVKKLGYRKMALTAKRRRDGLGKAFSCMFTFDLSVNPEDRKSESGTSKLPMFSNIQELDNEEIERNLIWANGVLPYVEIMRSDSKQLGHDKQDAAGETDKDDF